MKASGPSSLLPWIVHRGDWKSLRQAFSPLWSYSPGAWADVSVRICGHTLGHAYGVRVQKVQRVQRVVVAADAADYKKRGAAGAAGCVEGLWFASAQGATAPAALRVVVSPCGR